MSVDVPTETVHIGPAPSHRERADVINRLRQLMGQGVRVVRLGGRRRPPGEPAPRPQQGS